MTMSVGVDLDVPEGSRVKRSWAKRYGSKGQIFHNEKYW
jgi:hypothetical protein